MPGGPAPAGAAPGTAGDDMEKCGIETAVILGKQGGTQLQQLHMAGYELPAAVTRTIGGAMDQLGVLGAAPPTDYLGKLFLVLFCSILMILSTRTRPGPRVRVRRGLPLLPGLPDLQPPPGRGEEHEAGVAAHDPGQCGGSLNIIVISSAGAGPGAGRRYKWLLSNVQQECYLKHSL